jgi:hypothetical protein
MGRQQLPDAPRAAAMTDAGLLAVIDANEQVLLYDRVPPAGPLPAARKVAVGAQPRAIVAKRVGGQELLVVACAGDRALYLLDGRSGKLVRKINVPAGAPMGLIAPASPDVPLAYVALEPPVAALVRVDLQAYKVGDVLDASVGNFASGAATPDGCTLYVATTEDPGGRVVRPWRVEATGKAVERPNGQLYVTGRVLPDTRGQFIVAGATVADPLVTRHAAKLKGQALLLVPDRPVLVSIDGGELVVHSTNTWTELKRLPLPADFIPPLTKETLTHAELSYFKTAAGRLSLQQMAYNRIAEQGERGSPVVLGFYDAKARAIVLVYESRLLVVPLSGLALPDEPDLHFAVDAPPRVPVGRSWQATVRGNPKAELSVVEGPAYVKVEGQTITYTAPPADIGPVMLTVRATIGDVWHDETRQLVVSRPSVALGTPTIDRFALSPDGKRLITRGRVVDERQPQTKPLWMFSLIDLETFAVVAQRRVEANVQPESLALTDDVVVMGLADADAVLLLSAKDLGDAGRRFTKGRTHRLIVRGDRLYAENDFAAPAADSGGLTRYKLPGLEEDGRFDAYVFVTPQGDRADPEQARVPYRVREGTYFAGAVYGDEKLDRPVLLVSSPGFLQDVSTFLPFLPSRWGVDVRGNELFRNGGQLLRKIPDMSWPWSAIHPDVPLLVFAAGANKETLPGGREVVQQFELMAHDLSDGDLAGSVPIAREIAGDGGIPPVPVFVTPRGVVAAVRDRLYLVDDADVRAIPTKPPLMIYPKSPAIVLGAGVRTLDHVAENAEGDVQWSLRYKSDAVTVDAKTGTVTIDPAKLTASLPGYLREWATQWRSHRMIDGGVWERRRVNPPPPRVLLDQYCAAAADRAAALFGKPVAEVPTSVSVYLEAVDARGRSNATFYTVLLELPKAEVLGAFK